MVNLTASLREEIASCATGERCCAAWEVSALGLAFGKQGGARLRLPATVVSRLEQLTETTSGLSDLLACVVHPGQMRRCCRGAVLRGAFHRGSYLGTEGHLEFTTRSEPLAAMLLRTRVAFQRSVRNGRHVLYMKDQELIAETVGQMGAFQTMLTLEDLLVTRRMRNDINRVVNCEVGNLNRSSRCSVALLEDISYLTGGRGGLEALPQRLRQVAALRVRYPTASLRELAERAHPILTKSGMQHRIEELSRLAAEVRRQRT